MRYKERIFILAIFFVYLTIFLSIFFKNKNFGKENFVNFWHAGGGKERMKAIKILIKKFEKERGIKVKLKIIPWGQKPHEKIQIAIASRTEPDIASVGSPFDKIIADFGAVEPLQKYIGRSVLDDFIQKTTFKEGVASLPWFLDVRALIFRKDFLTEKNIPFPTESWSWEEFLKYARKLTVDKDGDGIVDIYGYGTTARYAYQFLTFIWENGGELYSKDGKKAFQNMDNIKEALKFFINLMIKEKVSPKFTTENMLIIRKMFSEGKIAMFMDCSDAALALRKELGDKVGVGFLPHKKKKAAYSGADSLVIFKKSKNKKEAIEFLKFLIRPDNMLFYVQKTGFSPSRKSVVNNKILKKDDIRRLYSKQAIYGRIWELPPFTPSPRRILTRYVQMIIERKLTLEEGLLKMKKEMEKEIGSLE